MPRTSVLEVLQCLEDEFADFASAFARGEYLLWLGSGISRDVVPSVPKLLENMIEFLRSRIGEESTCPFRRAFDEVLDVAELPANLRDSIDLASPVAGWPSRQELVDRLVDRYADVLDVHVADQADDFLLWDGLDVAASYGAPTLEPDAEHLCVAILMLEGLVKSAPTTNWDGLVESAMSKLVGDSERFLAVIVVAEDFRQQDRRAELLKFHGCAVRAAADEEHYRARLIARKTQISGWTTRPENEMMKHRLEHLFASRPALILGLSAQDANIHTVLQQAWQNLSRTWPTAPPAVVFAEQHLHRHHKHVMHVTYGDSYGPNVDAISSAALLGAYAKPTLIGLVLFALTAKLCALVHLVPELTLAADEQHQLDDDIRWLRDRVAPMADGAPRQFVIDLAASVSQTMAIFRAGALPQTQPSYQAVSTAPIAQAAENPDFAGAELGRLAVAVSLFAHGERCGHWQLQPTPAASAVAGILQLVRDGATSKVFVVRDARALAQLVADGCVSNDDGDLLVVQAQTPPPRSTRSPAGSYGRTGAPQARYVDLEGLCSTASSAEELFSAFRLEGVLG